MTSSLQHRVFRMALGLLLSACGVMAQNLPPGPPQAVPLPHPDLPPPAIPAPGPPLWALITGAVLVLLFVALFAWMLFKDRSRETTMAQPPLSRAQKRLRELLLECDTLPPDETAHRVSVILRDYQEGRYLVPAPFRTREELYDKGDLNVRTAVRERFGPIAVHSDRLAFAPAPATKEEARALVQQSIDALQQESYYVAEPARLPAPGLPPPSLPAPPSPPPEIIPPISP